MTTSSHHNWPKPWLDYLTAAGGIPSVTEASKGGQGARHHVIDVTSLLATLRTLTAHICAVALEGRDDLGRDHAFRVELELVIDAVYR